MAGFFKGLFSDGEAPQPAAPRPAPQAAPANKFSVNGGLYMGFQIPDPESPEDYPSQSLFSLPWEHSAEQWNYKSTTGNKHILTIGPNGSGKSRGLLIPNLIRLRHWSCVVIDPKGELAVQTAAYRQRHGSRIITLDPFGVIDAEHSGLTDREPCLKSAAFNPVSVLDPDDLQFVDDATALAETLIIDDPSGRAEKIWSQTARDLVTGLIMSMPLDERDNGPAATLETLRDYIGMAPEELGLLLRKQRLKDGSETPPGFIDNYGSKVKAIGSKLAQFAKVSGENKTLLSVLAEAKQQTSWLDSPIINASLGKNTARLDRLKDEPTTVYIVLPPDKLATYAAWMRLVLFALFKHLLKKKSGNVPVLFMLDEFATLGHVHIIEKNLGLLRGYGVKLWPILQNLGQLKHHYPNEWETFFGNSAVVQSYKARDKVTQDYFSAVSGTRFYWLKTSNTGGGTSLSQGHVTASDNRGEGWQQIKGPNIEPAEMGTIPDRHGVIFFDDGAICRAFFPDPSQVEGWKDVLRAAQIVANRTDTMPPAPASPPARDGVKMRCPSCQQVMNVRMGEPRKVQVTCPHCKHQFIFNPAR